MITFAPLTPATWPDLETVFNARGCAQARGCWCVYYRFSGVPPVDPALPRPAAHRLLLRRAVDAGEFTGILGYRDGEPAGWCALGPRSAYGRLARSPVMVAVDDAEVWSLVCFVVPSAHRRHGMATALLRAAQRRAAAEGVILEAYPVVPRRPARDDSLWFGTVDMYATAGFRTVAEPKPTRRVVRWDPAGQPSNSPAE